MNSALDLIELAQTICITLAVIGGGVAIIYKVVKLINEAHDRQQKYDGYDERIKNLDIKLDRTEANINSRIDDVQNDLIEKIQDAHGFAVKELKGIQDSMDTKLEELQTNNDAKFQQMLSELCMLSYCTLANLDGLKQLNCNGKVTEAKEKMEKHLNQQAHGEI